MRKHYTIHLQDLLAKLGIKGELILSGHVEQNPPYLHLMTFESDMDPNDLDWQAYNHLDSKLIRPCSSNG